MSATIRLQSQRCCKGCLMIQVTKINFILTGFAVAYGYIVFALDSRDSSENSSHRAIDTLEVAGAGIQVTGSKYSTEREEIRQPLLDPS